MKKKIIFVLSFLMMVLCLTGCGSTNVTPDEIREITEIAQNYKDIVGYELPEGYTCELADNKRNNQIVIETDEKTNVNHILYLTFDITKEKVQLLNIRDNYSVEYVYIGIITILLFLVVIVVAMASKKNNKYK